MTTEPFLSPNVVFRGGPLDGHTRYINKALFHHHFHDGNRYVATLGKDDAGLEVWVLEELLRRDR